jgi:6-pyruvoyl-tetrahydropterin synthase
VNKFRIGVSGHFSAAHRDQITGEIHGHTWHVLAKFETPTRVDSICYRAALNAMLAAWDHTLLPDTLAWGEDIAAAVGKLANCVEVEVSRPAEGFYVWWFA